MILELDQYPALEGRLDVRVRVVKEFVASALFS